MKIDRALVTRVAELANLKLTDGELTHYEAQMAKILGYVEQLSGLEDKLGKDWRSDTAGSSTPERPDNVQPSMAVDAVMAQAPASSGSVFQVPRIIE